MDQCQKIDSSSRLNPLPETDLGNVGVGVGIVANSSPSFPSTHFSESEVQLYGHDREERFSALSQVTSQIIWTTLPDGLVEDMPLWRAYTGQSAEAVRGNGWVDAIHPDDRERAMQAWTNAVASQTSYETEYRLRRKDGVYRTFLVGGAPVFEATGQIREWAGFCIDVHEQKLLEEQLRRSEQHYRTMFELASVGMAHVDLDGRSLQVNQKLCDILEYSHAELLRDSFHDLTYLEDRDISQTMMSRLLSGEIASYSTEKRYLRGDGSIIWCHLNTALVRDEAGKPLHFVSILEDISHRKQLEEQLVLSAGVATAQANQLEATIEAMVDGVMVYEADGRVFRANTAARLLFGVDQDSDYFFSTALEKRAEMLKIYDAEGALIPLQELPVRRILRGEVFSSSNALDVTLITLQGEKRELSISGGPVRDAQGKQTGGVAVFHDVTERRRLERRTQDSLYTLLAMAETLVQTAEGELNSSFETTGHRLVELTRSVLPCRRVGLVSFDQETGYLQPIAIIGLSEAFEQFLHATVWKRSLLEPFARNPLRRLYRNEVVSLNQEQLALLNWSNYGIQNLLLAPMLIGDQLIGLMGVEHNQPSHIYSPEETSLVKAIAKLSALVIERERLLQERSEARANELALSEANRRMDEFLSIASHELRTPLTAIKGNIQLARRRIKNLALPAELDENRETLLLLLNRAEHQIGVQNRMVSDLLDVSRIQVNQLELVFGSCDLVSIMCEAIEDQRQIVAPRPILQELDVEYCQIHADADRIGQVVNNYLTNALKYSGEEKPVLVQLKIEAGYARVSVTDKGQGLALEEQERIWERFYRAKGVHVQSGNGAGLGMGLHICRTIIERHGGQVGLESQPGTGSTFWFTLPLVTEDA